MNKGLNAKSSWWVLTLAVDPDHAEEVADVIREQLNVQPVQLDRPGARYSWLECYFDTEEEARIVEKAVGDAFDAAGTSIRRCDSRDWHTFWQTHFKPHTVGNRLFIMPVWEKDVVVPDGRRVLQIVPGLSFGTGEHFTTRFCLEMLDELTDKPNNLQTLWDVGCGSGILAVAGALLGIPHVVGTDNDSICLVQAAENAELNQVAEHSEWRVEDIVSPTRDGAAHGRYDVVCANLFSALLMQAAPRLWKATQQYLILSGIREFEADAIAETFVRLGATEIVRDGDGDWTGLLFRRDCK